MSNRSTRARARQTERPAKNRSGRVGRKGLALVPLDYGIAVVDNLAAGQYTQPKTSKFPIKDSQPDLLTQRSQLHTMTESVEKPIRVEADTVTPKAVTPEIDVPEIDAPETVAATSSETADSELLMPAPTPGPTKAERQRLQRVQNKARAAADTQQDMPPAQDNVAAARAAVNQPKEETASLAQAQLMAQLRSQAEPSPEILELCNNIQDAIKNRRPTDEDTLMAADPKKDADDVEAELRTQVQGDVNNVDQNYQSVNETVQPAPPNIGQPLQTPPASVESAPINSQQAAPDLPPPEQLSLDADVSASAERIDAAGMNTAPAQLVQSGPVADARQAQGELVQTAERDPAEVLAELNAARVGASANMQAIQLRALSAMSKRRRGTSTGIGNTQTGMVETEQQMRVRISGDADKLFQAAQNQANILLEPLVREAMKKWKAEVTLLTNTFDRDLNQVKGWIEDRYSGVGGTVVELIDAVFSMPSWITRAYDRAEKNFGDGVCRVLREISLDVNTVILTCETIIEDADTKIAKLYSTDLPDSLRDWAEGEQARFSGQLQDLRTQVNDTRNQFNQQISTEASQAVQKARQQVQALRDAAKGILEKVAEAVVAFIDDPARAIINGLLELVGIAVDTFWALINRIGSVVADIADDPLGFANNLAEALGQGFRQFFDRFGSHLLDGFFEWLFSGLGAVGVNVPSDFSLKSIVTFFLELMGITWDRIRDLMAKHIGKENIALLEQAYELISNLIEKGPEGIFEMLKQQFNPQTILDQVKQAAIDFVVETITTQVALRLLALFNPVGAILSAVELIYRILRWVFENAARIFSLVETVINGAADLIAGNLDGMANAIEGALGRLVAPVIDFISGYFGLDSLPDRIADTIRGFQEWIEGILDRVILWIAQRARGFLSTSKGAESDQDRSTPAEQDTELGETQTFSADGDRHRLWIDHNGREATVMLASTPAPLANQLKQWSNQINDLEGQSDVNGKPRKPQAEQLLKQAETMLMATDKMSDALTGEWQDYMRGRASGNRLPPDDDRLETKEQQLAIVLRELFELFGERAETGADIDSKITHRSRNFHGHQVGIEMVADPLTKNHPKGSEPKTSAQKGLMDKLNTATSGLKNNQFFLKGHLLNHNVGGIGIAKNLFPITGAANKDHLQKIETKVKDWIKGDRVVYYKVAVKIDDIDLSHDHSTPDKRHNYINSKFIVEANAKAKGNNSAETVSPPPIVSQYSLPSEEAYNNANSGIGRKEFRITDRVKDKTRDESLAELMKLNKIDKLKAGKLYERAISDISIGNYYSLIGITIQDLRKDNPDYDIVW